METLEWHLSPLLRFVLVAGLVLVVAVVAAVLVLCWTFLCREHARLPEWQVPLLWFGDVLALASFVWFVTRHGILGDPFAPVRLANVSRFEGWLVATLFGTITLNLLISGALLLWEEYAFTRAAEADATVHAIEVRTFPSSTAYAINCRFEDRNRRMHETRFVFFDVRDRPHTDKVFLAIRPQLLAGNVPFTVQVRYLPERPEANRVAGHIWWDQDRLHAMMLVLQSFQFCGIGCFIGTVTSSLRQHKRLPWWWESYQLIPVLAGLPLILILLIGEAACGRLSWVAG